VTEETAVPLRADSHYASRFSSVTVPSSFRQNGPFTLSVVFSHLPEQHMIGGLGYFHRMCCPYSFSKRKLAVIALMLDEGEKYAAFSDKKNSKWVHKCFRSRKSEGEYWTVYKELADDEMKFYQFFFFLNVQAPIKLSA
jgi:hypothetical protein